MDFRASFEGDRFGDQRRSGDRPLGSEEAVFEEMGREGTRIGKFNSPEEIAGRICFLLSDACSTVTGEIFLYDGGFTL